ncbi:MAG: aldo/keto reductase [Verrucomicrobiae bacterium]|nr:aldo/keto reductase [Verrucomicrobiae bacterium]
MIQKRSFGRTGHESSIALFGAAALGRCDQAIADETLDILFRYGVNHIDTAPGYGDSELRIGPWMKKYRSDFFLATKTDQRTYREAREQIHKSLDRLQTDHVDLLQFHALFHPDEWDTVMGEGGALEAALEAREAGLVKYLGVTGHNWTIAAMHKRSLERYDFDSVLLPCNYLMLQRPEYRRDFQQLLNLCEERQVAVQLIKTIARGPWATTPKYRTTWYQPLEEQEDIDRGVHFGLSQGSVFLNTAGDLTLLPKFLDAATRYAGAPTDDEMRAMLDTQTMTSIFGL